LTCLFSYWIVSKDLFIIQQRTWCLLGAINVTLLPIAHQNL
jgi:hypothetical protein